MHSQGVCVQVEHSAFGLAKGSGLQINNIVITHGMLLAPLCLAKCEHEDMFHRFNTIIKELHNLEYYRPINSKNITNKNPIKFKVLRKSCLCVNQNSSKKNNMTLGRNESIVEEAGLGLIYNYKALTDITKEISNWTFSNSDDENDDRLLHIVLPTFLFLVLGKPSQDLFEETLHTTYKLLKNVLLYPGLPLVVESTPYGNIAFTNSWSRGVISKMIGPNWDGILTDARLVSGCEGAPIYVFENGVKGALVGLVVQTISGCNGEWVGFSLAVSLKHLLKAVLGLESITEYLPFNKLHPEWPTSQVNIDRLSSSVVFIRCSYKLGSGIVIDAADGIILTCSHVIDHQQGKLVKNYKEGSPLNTEMFTRGLGLLNILKDHSAVFVFCEDGRFPASVVYASPSSSLYDLAILSIGRVPGLRQLLMAETPPIMGEKVITAGYPLSTESLVGLNRMPTLSAGCVSKISSRGGPLQTTCCTQSGVSGGALIRPPDELLGVVVSNICVDTTVVNSFSFAISVEDIRKPTMEYLRSKGVA